MQSIVNENETGDSARVERVEADIAVPRAEAGSGLATVTTYALYGFDARMVQIEVDVRRGPALWDIHGLAETSARETRVRVRAAMQRLDVDLSDYAIRVDLAPLDLPKSGGSFDLAIAIALLAALGKIPKSRLDGTLFLGELSLTAALRPVRGVLPTLLGARRNGTRRAIVPGANSDEAAFVDGISVSSADSLRELVEHLALGAQLATVGAPRWITPSEIDHGVDVADVRGLSAAKRALEIAAAGAHNMIMIGQPGSGKTMLARRLTTILPPMTRDESLEVTAVHSVAGLLRERGGVLQTRPFRAPHHTVSAAGLVGGGDPLRPGEISLAHLGCLFLDDLIEFRRNVLESLFTPVDKGRVSLRRAGVSADFPARALLVAAIQPCPCGFAGNPLGPKKCTCTPERVQAYRKKIPAPLLDRIDLDVVLPPLNVEHVSGAAPGESSATVRERVIAARAYQSARWERGDVEGKTNSQLNECDLERVATPDKDGARVLTSAVERLGLSAVARCKLLRVARTIADLDDSSTVRALHVAEALTSRVLDRASPSNTPKEGDA